MKSFKQKVEEKQKRLAQERIEAEKQRLIELEKEQSKLLEKEIKDEAEANAKLLAEEEVRKWKEYQKNRKANKIPDTPSISLEEKIENYRTDQENKKLFRSNQKDSIKEILENESDIRNKIQDEYVQSDIE